MSGAKWPTTKDKIAPDYQNDHRKGQGVAALAWGRSHTRPAVAPAAPCAWATVWRHHAVRRHSCREPRLS